MSDDNPTAPDPEPASEPEPAPPAQSSGWDNATPSTRDVIETDQDTSGHIRD